jgi:hypothetical protein
MSKKLILTIANKTIKLFGILLLAYLSGCSSDHTRIIKNVFKETPKASKTNMSNAIQCMGRQLEKTTTTKLAYVFLVREITDGTITNSIYQNGPLSDAGRIQLIHALSEHTFPYLGLVTDQFPLMFKQQPKEGVGINRFGLTNNNNMNTFLAVFGSIIGNARKQKQLPPIAGVVPLVISGSFTRLDNDNLYQEGWGHNGGSRDRGGDNDYSGQIDYGKTSSSKMISLIINLIEPRYNLVVASQSFDLIFSRENKRFRLRFTLHDGFYGVSKDEIEVEGLHGAQQTLIDAAALWILNRAYGEETNFKTCFTLEQAKLTKNSEAPPVKKKPVEAPTDKLNGNVEPAKSKPTQENGTHDSEQDNGYYIIQQRKK